MKILMDEHKDPDSRVEGTKGGRRPSEVPSTSAAPAGQNEHRYLVRDNGSGIPEASP